MKLSQGKNIQGRVVAVPELPSLRKPKYAEKIELT